MEIPVEKRPFGLSWRPPTSSSPWPIALPIARSSAAETASPPEGDPVHEAERVLLDALDA
jgi:hypothetical protein